MHVLAVWALVYAALMATSRNLYGQGFVDAWGIVILVAVTLPCLRWAHLERRDAP